MNTDPFTSRFNLDWWNPWLDQLHDVIDVEHIRHCLTTGVTPPFTTEDNTVPSVDNSRQSKWTLRQTLFGQHNVIRELLLGRYEGPFIKTPNDVSVSPIFVLTTESGLRVKHRLIYDLSAPGDDGLSINDFTALPLRPVPLATLQDMCQAGMEVGPRGYIVGGDLQGAYRLQHLEHGPHRAFGFRFRGRTYINKVIPWGWNFALEGFARVSDAFKEVMRARFPVIFQRLLAYVDDFIAFLKRLENAKRACQLLCTEAPAAGYAIQLRKIQPPARVSENLGMVVDLPRQCMRLADVRIAKYAEQTSALLRSPRQLLAAILRYIGRIQFACVVMTYGQLRLRFIRIEVHYAIATGARLVDLSSERIRIDLLWILRSLRSNPSVPFHCVANNNKGRGNLPALAHAYSDAASTTGLGGLFLGHYWQLSLAQLPTPFHGFSINVLECLAAAVTTFLAAPLIPGMLLMLNLDNQGLVAMVNNRDTKHAHIVPFLRFLCDSAEKHRVFLVAQYLPTEVNFAADSCSRDFPLSPEIARLFRLRHKWLAPPLLPFFAPAYPGLYLKLRPGLPRPLRHRLHHHRQKTTRDTYLSSRRSFARYLTLHTDRIVGPRDIPREWPWYVHWRALHDDVGAGSIRSDYYAMKAWLKDHNFDVDLLTHWGRAMWQHVSISKKMVGRPRTLIHPALLALIVSTMRLWETRAMYTAACALCFGLSCCARPGEMAAAKAKATGSSATIKIWMLKFLLPEKQGDPIRFWSFTKDKAKNDPTARGRILFRGVKISAHDAVPHALDTGFWLAKMLTDRFGSLEEAKRHPNSYLFAPYEEDRCLTQRQLTKLMRLAIVLLGLPADQYSLGGIRKGAATLLLANGTVVAALCDFIGWKSHAFLHYLGDSRSWQRETARGLHQPVGPSAQGELKAPKFVRDTKTIPSRTKHKSKPTPEAHPEAVDDKRSLTRARRTLPAFVKARHAKPVRKRPAKPAVASKPRKPRKPAGPGPLAVAVMKDTFRGKSSSAPVGSTRALLNDPEHVLNEARLDIEHSVAMRRLHKTKSARSRRTDPGKSRRKATKKAKIATRKPRKKRGLPQTVRLSAPGQLSRVASLVVAAHSPIPSALRRKGKSSSRDPPVVRSVTFADNPVSSPNSSPRMTQADKPGKRSPTKTRRSGSTSPAKSRRRTAPGLASAAARRATRSVKPWNDELSTSAAKSEPGSTTRRHTPLTAPRVQTSPLPPVTPVTRLRRLPGVRTSPRRGLYPSPRIPGLEPATPRVTPPRTQHKGIEVIHLSSSGSSSASSRSLRPRPRVTGVLQLGACTSQISISTASPISARAHQFSSLTNR